MLFGKMQELFNYTYSEISFSVISAIFKTIYNLKITFS